MAYGPGKYDALATELREKSEARGVIAIVIDGKLGSGFSVQADLETLAKLPDMLENMAQQIRASSH